MIDLRIKMLMEYVWIIPSNVLVSLNMFLEGLSTKLILDSIDTKFSIPGALFL